MENQNNQQTDVTSTAIKAVAAMTKTPFRTAFLATLGVAVAHLVTFILTAGTIGTVCYFLFRK